MKKIVYLVLLISTLAFGSGFLEDKNLSYFINVKTNSCEKISDEIKRRLLELQGDWKPDFNDDSSKYTICYDHIVNSFTEEEWQRFKHCVLIPYMENKEIALTIINEFHEELKLIFDIA